MHDDYACRPHASTKSGKRARFDPVPRSLQANGHPAHRPESWSGILNDLARSEDTPLVVVDSEALRRNCKRFRALLPGVTLLYAMKALPDTRVTDVLGEYVDGFDAASLGEIESLLDRGVEADRIEFNNPVKSPVQIEAAASLGITRFACQSAAEVHKIDKHAPSAEIMIRVRADDSTSQVPLSSKFGTRPQEVRQLAELAGRTSLQTRGLAFHVGSQASDPNLWRSAIEMCVGLLRMSSTVFRDPISINIGGGFPVPYLPSEPRLEHIAVPIFEAVSRNPGFQFVAEPGRFLVADAASILASVIGIESRNGRNWAFLDIGHFQAFVGASRYPYFPYTPYVLNRHGEGLSTQASGNQKHVEYTLTGPSCDSFDIIAPSIRLPEKLSVGDHLVFPNAGAYTIAYGSSFNGFPVPRVLCTD